MREWLENRRARRALVGADPKGPKPPEDPLEEACREYIELCEEGRKPVRGMSDGMEIIMHAIARDSAAEKLERLAREAQWIGGPKGDDQDARRVLGQED